MSEGHNRTSTIPREKSGTNGWETGLRSASVYLVGILVGMSAIGLLGARTQTATGSGNGYIVSVEHASVTRPGLATPFSISVSRGDGGDLPQQITTRVEASYLEMFDENGISPQPVSWFQDPQSIWWTFAVPAGERIFEVAFDARLEPAVQWGQRASVALEIKGAEVVDVDFETWVMP